jgi:hypothetical protein
MRQLIAMLGVFLAADALCAQQAALALPEKEKDLTSPDQTVTVVIGSIGLVAAAAVTPYIITYGGETQIGPFRTPYWALDAAGALIALAALNYTFNEIYHIVPDRSLISIFGIAIGKF